MVRELMSYDPTNYKLVSTVANVSIMSEPN